MPKSLRIRRFSLCPSSNTSHLSGPGHITSPSLDPAAPCAVRTWSWLVSRHGTEPACYAEEGFTGPSLMGDPGELNLCLVLVFATLARNLSASHEEGKAFSLPLKEGRWPCMCVRPGCILLCGQVVIISCGLDECPLKAHVLKTWPQRGIFGRQ